MLDLKSWAAMCSSIATPMFLWAFARRFHRLVPFWLKAFLFKYAGKVLEFLNPYIRIKFYDYNGRQLRPDPAFNAIETYLTATCSPKAKKFRAEATGSGNSKIELSMDIYEEVTDEFQGAKFWWTLKKVAQRTHFMSSNQAQEERRFYQLTFHRTHRQLVVDSYLGHIMENSKARNRRKKLYANASMWTHVVFEHPATFHTLAMDPEKKKEIIQDLVTFKEAEAYYQKIGKTWKRGYLLYGPPGTGKSTMIAAMANFLDYNIYDLELMTVKDNTELRKLLLETSSRSIIVIEDIDCSADLSGKRKNKESEKSDKNHSNRSDKEDKSSKITLSGLLNFIDGLWSCCGKQQIIVFTTNHVDKLDPALIRRGRMDKHIELSYCTFEGFKLLAKNYLDLELHPKFEIIEKLIKEAKITPADVAENLMLKSSTATAAENTENCLENLIQALRKAKEEAIRSTGNDTEKMDKSGIREEGAIRP